MTNDISKQRKYASLFFVLIKKINRLVKYKIRLGREGLHHEKVQADSNRLQLQNLLYEVNHLSREIRYCHQFKSQDEDIELLPEIEYLNALQRDAPQMLEYNKHLNLLEWELRLRKQLSAKYKQLYHTKNMVFQNIIMKSERFSSFNPSLRSLLSATGPLQDALQIPIERKWKIERMVQLLPQPLYLAYINIYALAMTMKSELCVEIVGSEEDVYQNDILRHTELLNSFIDSEMEELQVKHAQTLKPYPLEIRFSIGVLQDMENCICVHLRFFQRLGFVTASTVNSLNEMNGSSGEIPFSHDILKYLYDNDSGNIIPICGMDSELKKINMTPEECLLYLNCKNFGKPYRWIQRICGIKVYGDINTVCGEINLQKNLFELVKKLKTLWNSQLNLIQQIKALVNKNVELYLKDEHCFLIKPSCTLVQWTSIVLDEYIANKCTSNYYDMIENNLFYRAVVVRGSAKMECLISIPNKFPFDSPIWVLSIYWNGQHNSLNNAAIKMMEYWTNCIIQRELKNQFSLLSSQLYRTMHSFDIFLETEGPLYSPVEYNKEKQYIKSFSKRIRARPFRFIKGGAINSFKQ